MIINELRKGFEVGIDSLRREINVQSTGSDKRFDDLFHKINDMKNTISEKIEQNSADIKGLDQRLSELEKDYSERKGSKALLIGLGGFISAIISLLIHFIK